MKKDLLISLILFLSLIFNSNAGIDDQINQWFKNQNYVNITDPGVYEGQGARFTTFGGISSRTPIASSLKLLDVQTPKFTAGCAGIDYYAGGFKAINADQFISNLRMIGQNAQSLAFMLAIQIVSPQLSGVMENIANFANKYLQMNMDSCEAATKLVGGTMDFFGAKESNCTIKRMQDLGEDWAVANHNCTTGGKVKETEARDGGPNQVEFIKGNLAWSVLMNDPFFKDDKNFAEVIMNITGTIIISDADTSDNGPSKIQIIDPVALDIVKKDRYENIYKSLLFGKNYKNNLKIYRCKDSDTSANGCLRLSSELEEITPTWTGLHERVLKIVKDIVKKIYDDQPLTQEEIGLISSTQIPIYRLLLVTSAYFPRQLDITRSIHDYTNLIAEDILLTSLNAILSRVEQQASMMPNGMSGSKRLLDYKSNIQRVLNSIAHQIQRNEDNTKRFLEMQQRIQLYEKALMSRLGSGIISNAMWGNN